MSSTNRGARRTEFDYYRTPQAEIEKFLLRATWHMPFFLDGIILDPCAGGDPKYPAMPYPEELLKAGVKPTSLITTDIRMDSSAEFTGIDYLEQDFTDVADRIIANPPFNLAEEFIVKALREVRDGGLVTMLLRVNFFGSQGRYERLWGAGMLPSYAFVHATRMGFREDRQTDSIEYMHAVWQKGVTPQFTQLQVVN